MAGDDTTAVLGEASTAAVWLMLSILPDYDVVQAYETTEGRGTARVSRNRRRFRGPATSPRRVI